jgi:uncharacterized protein
MPRTDPATVSVHCSMDEFDFSSTIETLDQVACRTLLSGQSTGRVAYLAGDFPMILPVNFVVVDDFVVFRTDPGSKLENIPLQAVAFEADGWDQTGAWSVVVQGFAREVTNALGDSYDRLRQAHMPLLAPGDKSHWIAIEIRTMSGRALKLRGPK